MPALTMACAALIAYVIVWSSVLVTVAVSDGVGETDWWAFPETVFPIVAASFLGCLIGHVVRGIAAPLVAAVVVMLAAVVASPWGRGPFEAVTTYGTWTGFERPADQAIAALLVSVVTVVVCAVAVWSTRARTMRRWVAPLVALGLLVPIWIAPAAWPWSDEVYRTYTEPLVCAGSKPALCGPRSRLPLFERAQPSFALAYARLEGTPFTAPTRFQVARGGEYSKLNGAAALEFDPAAIGQSGYDMGLVADALLQPHVCAETFEAASAMPILEAEEAIDPWITEVIQGRKSARPVPPEITKAFSTIQNCTVFTGDWGK